MKSCSSDHKPYTMAEGEDLYDDLYQDVGDALPFQSFLKSDAREDEFRKKEAELNGKVELLQKEVEALQREKVVLTRNISCLFKTAQMELARKDKQMKELRDENLRFKLGGTKGQSNVRPHLNKIDKILGQDEKNHHISGTVGATDKRLQLGSSDSRRSMAPTSEAAFYSEESSSRRPGSSESTRVRELGHRQSSNECRSPSRGHQQRDIIPDNCRNLQDDKDGRPRDRSRYDDKAEYGHKKGRSPDQRSRDRTNSIRDSDNYRKRHRSLSGEKDEDSERSRAPKAVSRERQNDHFNRHHR